MTEKPKRGFAALSPERRREIASMGGKSVPPEKRAFSQDSALKIEAGRKGGRSIPAELRSFSRDRELAERAGRAGGLSPRRKRNDQAS
jgi:uncharacterized protein